MKQYPVFFFVVIMSMLAAQDAAAKRAPHMKFDIEVNKGSHFIPVKGSCV